MRDWGETRSPAGGDELFAEYYDDLVHGRREAFAAAEDLAFVRDAFAARVDRSVVDILDAGCGTGRYLVPLAVEGFRMTGLDLSAAMITKCALRLQVRGLQARLVEGDLRTFTETEQYDAVLCMNSVLVSILDAAERARVLSNLWAALRPGGLLVLEIWDVAGASAEFGGTVRREIPSGERTIVSRETALIDPAEHVYRARYDVSVRSPSGDANFEHEEVLRVLTVDDVVAELTAAGFTEIDAQTRPDMLEPESGDLEFWFLAGRP